MAGQLRRRGNNPRQKQRQDNRRQKTLQVCLLQAVITGARDAAREAIEALNEYFKPSVSGPGPLDFTCKQINDTVKNEKDKTFFEGEHKKFMAYSPLMAAAELGDIEMINLLLSNEASAAFRNKDGLSALHIACHEGALQIVETILVKSEKQQNFTRKTRRLVRNDQLVILNSKFRPNGWTPLMYAVKKGHVEVVKCLMKCTDLDLWIKNRKQHNVFHIAVREGQLECMEQLIADAASDVLIGALKTTDGKNWNILHQACTQDKISVKWLLEKFEELKTKGFLNQLSKAGYTPFLVACEYHRNNGDTVNYFIDTLFKEGLVDISVMCHQEGDLGTSALHLAAIHNNRELAEILVKAESSLIATRDKAGNTVLHVAMARGNRSVAKCITEMCKSRGKELESVTNNAGKVPKDVEEEIVIPPEILRLGPEVVAAYEKALEEGKRKIPYCGMLILGESKVGKTSLYRQLVGKEFLKDLESTKGIDNNTVDTLVEERSVVTGNDWCENESSAGEAFAKAAGEETRNLMPSKTESKGSNLPSSAILLKIINKVKKELHSELMERKHFEMLFSTILEGLPTEEEHIPPNHVPESPIFSAQDTPAEKPSREASQTVKPVPAAEATRQEPKPKPRQVQLETQVTVDRSQSVTPIPSVPESKDKVNHISAETAQEMDKQEAIDQNTLGITRRDSSIIAGIAKGRVKHDEQRLILNCLDFAGQPEYRPMHHCFISRRACYLVVFKIPDMVRYIQNHSADGKRNSWEAFRYWIHSINAHIYPPDKEEKKEMATLRRIILVGTHREDVSEKDLKDTDEFLKDNIDDDERCIDHVATVNEKLDKALPTNYYIPVENSIDVNTCKGKYLSESGTKSVQMVIEKLSDELSFLKEVYPIKWLKFNERIEVAAPSSPVLTVQDLKEMAIACRIHDEDQQKLAVKFLHDSGRIICLDYVSNLFLSNREKAELSDKVVIRPQWLISVMKEVMRLNLRGDNKGVAKSLVATFCKTGEADIVLLKNCWRQYLADTKVISLRHLCLLLQAYCLIFPLNPSEGKQCSESTQNEEAAVKSGSNDTCGNSVDGNSTAESKLYLIPCKLPEVVKPKCNVREEVWTSFYFNFNGFLPAEVYHKFLCKHLMITPISSKDNSFSQEECIIFTDNENWRIRYKEFDHMLEVAVAGSSNLKETINYLHKSLSEICSSSHLEGLNYYGGLSKTHCKCGPQTLHYATFKNGKPSEIKEDKIKCMKCKQPIKDEQKIPEIPVEVSSIDVTTSCQDPNDRNVFKMLYPARASWYVIGVELEVNISTLQAFNKDHGSVDEKLGAVINHWLCKSTNKSWTVLAEAMGSGTVNQEDIKERIIAKYCALN